jgi:hypothetical protein
MHESLALCLLLAPLAAGQMPPIGIIDFYGLRQLSERQVREALQIREGDPGPESEKAASRAIESDKQRLRALPGVRDVEISGVCCDAGRLIVYVGIVEAGGKGYVFARPPAGKVRLPEEVVTAGQAFEEALMAAVQKGDTGEDDTLGHSLSNNPAVRAIQDRFTLFAASGQARLRDVLAHSADAEHRALAAQVLGYVADKRTVVADLTRAMRDPAEGVRNNAMRALAVIADFADRNPRLHISVAPGPFVDLLDSPVWTDRNKAVFALTVLTENRDPALLARLRQQALPSLVEMARWKSSMHALGPLLILGRVAGLPDGAMRAMREPKDRETIIQAALASSPAGRK